MLKLVDVKIDVAGLVSQAAQSPLGILSLICLILLVIAYVFFKDAGERVKLIVFVLLLLAACGFAAAVLIKVNEANPQEKQYPPEGRESPVINGSNDTASAKPVEPLVLDQTADPPGSQPVPSPPVDTYSNVVNEPLVTLAEKTDPPNVSSPPQSENISVVSAASKQLEIYCARLLSLKADKQELINQFQNDSTDQEFIQNRMKSIDIKLAEFKEDSRTRFCLRK